MGRAVGVGGAVVGVVLGGVTFVAIGCGGATGARTESTVGAVADGEAAAADDGAEREDDALAEDGDADDALDDDADEEPAGPPLEPFGPAPVALPEGDVEILGFFTRGDATHVVLSEPGEEDEQGMHTWAWTVRPIAGGTLGAPIASGPSPAASWAKAARSRNGARIVYPAQGRGFEMVELGASVTQGGWASAPAERHPLAVALGEDGAPFDGLVLTSEAVYRPGESASQVRHGERVDAQGRREYYAEGPRPEAFELALLPVGSRSLAPIRVGRFPVAEWDLRTQAAVVGARGATAVFVHSSQGDARAHVLDVVATDARGAEAFRLQHRLPDASFVAGPAIARSSEGRTLVALGVSHGTGEDALRFLVIDPRGRVLSDVRVPVEGYGSARTLSAVACGDRFHVLTVWHRYDRRGLQVERYTLAPGSGEAAAPELLYRGPDVTAENGGYSPRDVFSTCAGDRPISLVEQIARDGDEGFRVGALVL